MIGKTIIRKRSIPILALIVLFLATGPASAGEQKTDDLRGDTTYSQRCEIPYNIDDYGYTTGLHFVTNKSINATIRLYFYCGGVPYATRDIVVPPEGATGTAQEFLPAGYKLRFPTLIYAEMVASDSGDTDRFWVTQFLFTNSGFSHQTLESHPF